MSGGPTQSNPGKYVYVSQRRLEPSPDSSRLHPGSRYVGHLRGNAYVDAINDYANGRLLDLGCGARPLRMWYDSVVTDSIGVDWSIDCTPDIVADIGRPLPFADGSFDTILASDVFEHLPDLYAAFGETARLLREGGTAIIGTPFLYMVHEAPHDYLRPTEHLLRLAATRVGLVEHTIQPIGGAPDVAFDLTSKFIARGPVTSKMVYRACRALASTRQVARISERTSGSFPLGYLAVLHKAFPVEHSTGAAEAS